MTHNTKAAAAQAAIAWHEAKAARYADEGGDREAAYRHAARAFAAAAAATKLESEAGDTTTNEASDARASAQEAAANAEGAR